MVDRKTSLFCSVDVGFMCPVREPVPSTESRPLVSSARDSSATVSQQSTRQTMFLFRHSRLRIAFKWMMRGFSGYLASNQLLALWDRILAYESLELLSGSSN